jgi:hypothetical protein
MRPKVVQIACCSSGDYQELYALTEDGRVWRLFPGGTWLEEPPVTEEVRSPSPRSRRVAAREEDA